jgi:hypothetical protein
MHCPECHSLNDTLNGACPACGLLLLNFKPTRRAEDLATKKRRKDDRQESATCPFCQGEIARDAVRCKHCSEIVDDDYYRARSQRLRSRVNYASWVAYLFGLGALLVFRPVGIVSIGAGLLLSILYYAIPVEPPATKRNPHRLTLGRRLKKQFKLERVSIPIPALRKKRLVFIGTPLIAAMIGYSANVFLLQEPMNDVLRQNVAFRGMNVSAHYEYWVIPGVVVYDLRDLSFRQTPIDVHTAFLEFAKRMRAAKVKRVELSYRGTTKFTIDGAAFHRLGDEYSKRNFEYVLYTFPRLFHSVGSDAPSQAANSERDALLRFHRHWYGEDQMTRSVANGM